MKYFNQIIKNTLWQMNASTNLYFQMKSNSYDNLVLLDLTIATRYPLNYHCTTYKIHVHFIHECNVQITWQLAARLYTKWISFKSHVEEELRSKPFKRMYLIIFTTLKKS